MSPSLEQLISILLFTMFSLSSSSIISKWVIAFLCPANLFKPFNQISLKNLNRAVYEIISNTIIDVS